MLSQAAMEESSGEAQPSSPTDIREDEGFQFLNLQRVGLHTVVSVGAVHTWDSVRKSWALNASQVGRYVEQNTKPSWPNGKLLGEPQVSASMNLSVNIRAVCIAHYAQRAVN